MYALVSDENDFYYEQLLISVYSLRRHNSDAVVEVVADEDTVRAVLGSDREVHKYIDKVVVADVPKEYSKMQRSRWIKTRLRRLVEGDYLFVDTDTVICDSLAECDDFEHDLCVVREKNYFDCFSEEDEVAFRWASSIGKEKELIGEPYFNSGVMYVRDAESSYLLYDAWHEQWQECRKLGLDKDQVALGLANKRTGHLVKNMEDKWNCQIKANGKKYAWEAKILHYFYCKGEMLYPLSSDAVYKTIRQHDCLPPFVQEIIASPKKVWVQAEDVARLSDLESFVRLQRFCPDVFEQMKQMAESQLMSKKSDSNCEKVLSVIVVRNGASSEMLEKCMKSMETESVEVLKVEDFDGVLSLLDGVKGKYVKIVSGSDWMEESLLNEFVERLRNEDSDLVISDYQVNGKLVSMRESQDGMRVKMLKGVAAPKNKFGWFPPETITYRTEMVKALLANTPKISKLSALEWEFYPLFYVEDIVYWKIAFCNCDNNSEREGMQLEQMLKALDNRIAAAERMLAYYVAYDQTFISAGTQIMLWVRLKRVFFPLMSMLMSMSSNERALVLMERLSKCLEQDPKLMKETREAVLGSM